MYSVKKIEMTVYDANIIIIMLFLSLPDHKLPVIEAYHLDW